MKDRFRDLIIMLGGATLSLVTAVLIGHVFFNLGERSLPMQAVVLMFLTVIFWIYFYAVISKLSPRYAFASMLAQVFASLQISVDWFSEQSDIFLINFHKYIKKNSVVLFGLGIIALITYGFELFNLNLTVDEEFHAFLEGPLSLWIGEGRWGMYLLNKFLLPYAIIPTVPLFIGLVFHLFAILLILDCWKIESVLEQVVCGAILLTFPTFAFIYEFSSLNFGIGIGFFCAGWSVFLFSKNKGIRRWLVIFPAGFAIAIYQPFALMLAAIFLVHFIIEIRSNHAWFRDLLFAAMALSLAFLFYYLVEKLFLFMHEIGDTPYVSHYFNFSYLFEQPIKVLSESWTTIINYYSGSDHIYGIKITTLGLLLIVSLAGITIRLIEDNLLNHNFVISILLSLAVLLIPFADILFSRGMVISRTLVALPISIAGIFILGLPITPRIIRFFTLMLAIFSVFQFMTANNRLFSSSHLALQADRLLAVRLMDKIDEAKSKSGILDPKYVDVIGDLSRPETQPILRRETFGISFFELKGTGGQIYRISFFLQISGYSPLEALPELRRIEFMDAVNRMSVWPAEGSVMVVKDTVLIRFSDYSYRQRIQICINLETNLHNTKLPKDFCPKNLPQQ